MHFCMKNMPYDICLPCVVSLVLKKSPVFIIIDFGFKTPNSIIIHDGIRTLVSVNIIYDIKNSCFLNC